MIKLLCENTNLTLDENYSLTLNYNFLDVDNLSTQNSNFSQTIILEGDDVNNKFFAHNYDVSIKNLSFNPNLQKICHITDESGTIMQGTLQLLRIVVNQQAIEYEVQISGILKSLLSDLGNLTTKSLDFSDYNHTRDKETIRNSQSYKVLRNNFWQENLGPGDGYVYPYILHGHSTNIYQNLYVHDCFPGIYLKTIVERLFKKINKKVNSKFFESDYFKKIFIPFTGDSIKMTEEEFASRLSNIGVEPNIEGQYINILGPVNRDTTQTNDFVWNFNKTSGQVEQEIFSNGSGQFAGGFFTVNKIGVYDILLNTHIVPRYVRSGGGSIQWNGTGSLSYNYQIIRDSSGTLSTLFNSDLFLFSPSDGASHDSPWYDLAGALKADAAVQNVALLPGDKLYVYYQIDYPTSGTSWAGIGAEVSVAHLAKQSLDGDPSFLKLTPSSNDSMGNEPIMMNEVSPNFPLADLLKDLIKIFNLKVKYINSDEILIEPEDDFYETKKEVKNIDELFDESLGMSIIPTSEADFKQFIFSWKDDTDYLNEKYKQQYGENFGTKNVYFQNDFSQKIEKYESAIFAATPTSDRYIAQRVAPQFFKVNDEGDISAAKIKPRLLFYGGLKNGHVIYLQDNAADLFPDTWHSYAYCGMWDDNKKPNYSLEFDFSNIQYFNTNVTATLTIFQKFYSKKFNNLTSQDSKIVEGYFWLNNKFMASLDERDIMEFKGQFWRLISIENYDVTADQNLVKVRMYKLLNFNANAKNYVDKPINKQSCPVDIQSVVGKDGRIYFESNSGQVITEDCCKSYGGIMSDGVCWLPRRIFPQTESAFSDYAPTVELTDSNTVNSPGVKVYGRNGFVGENVENGIVMGDYTTISNNARNVFSIGERNSVGRNAKNIFLLGDDFDGEFLDRNDCIFGNDIKLRNTGSIEIGDLIITSASTISGGNFLPLTGGTMSGDITMSTSTKVKGSGDGFVEFLGDDIFISSTSSFIQIAAGPDEIFISTGDLKILGDLYNENKDVITTTGDTETTLKTLQLTANDTNYQIETNVMVVKDNGIDGGSIKLLGTFNRLAGVVVQIGQTVVTSNLTKPIEAFYDIDGIDVRVRVVGESGQIYKWGAQQIINKLTY